MDLIVRILSLGLAMVMFLFQGDFSTAASYLKILPDTAEMGLSYLDFSNTVEGTSKKEMAVFIDEAQKDVKHPFILAEKEDFDKVRTEYFAENGDEYIKEIFGYSMERADQLAAGPLVEYIYDDDDGILEVSRQILSRVITLSAAWQVTGEEKYAAKAFAELEAACNYDDWNPDHFLDVAEMALAMSIGYDWLFDYLTDAQKELIRTNVYEKAITPAIKGDILAQNWWIWSNTNWNTVCYSGIGIACMTFSEYYEKEAADILSKATKWMPMTFALFTPEGVYVEGTGYWEYCTTYLVYFLSTSRNYFGTDFGLSEIDGVDKVGYYPIYVTGAQGVFNYGDNKPEPLHGPSMQWFADEYNSPLLAEFQKTANPRNNEDREATLSAIWYDTSFSGENADFSNEPLALFSKSSGFEDMAIMRSAYLDPNATFAAIKSGYNYTNHGDLDVGTFVFDAMGERWAEELGPGDYGAPQYFAGLVAFGRWQVYRKRAEGQNTLVINPDKTPDDQYAFAKVEISSFQETSHGGKAIIDMTEAYCLNGVKDVVREFEMFDNHSKLRITDTISCHSKSEIYWFMHTKAAIEILDAGKTAKLTIGDKHLRATLDNCDGTFSVMDAVRLDGTVSEYDKDNTDIQKLTVHLEDIKEAKINVILEPWVD
ncbi:MAG: heparinase II/III family protein [Clostridia bacterium]|nr:heparinase II/III family protein [Clostridia bacterium]